MRRIVVNALKAVGITDVVEAGDGREALGRASDADLVITDWNMPVMGGLELVQALRAAPATAKTPILMLTTRSVKDDIIAAMGAGVSNYVLKPFTPQILKEKIDSVMVPT
jgi:two-component system chemotaxis response regulator CheY